MNKHNLCLCHHAVLGSRNFAICFLSQLFYSHFDIVKILMTVLFSILFDDTMTYRKSDERLSSVMNRVADSHPEKQGSKPAGASSFF